jgi:curved DNA-binding protein CbpA
MLDGLQLDPYEVLDVPRSASDEEIREAFHRKSKKHHPDAGGDQWAFRIVALAYQALAASRPEAAGARPAAPPHAGPREITRLRAGVTDRDVEPARRVAVEVLWRRYEVGDFLDLLSESPGRRNLSGSLALTWPDPEADGPPLPAAHLPLVHRALNAAFDDIRRRTPVLTAQSNIAEGRFEAALTYRNGPVAADAFKRLHVSLRARGLGVRQWTRDVTVPREPVA